MLGLSDRRHACKVGLRQERVDDRRNDASQGRRSSVVNGPCRARQHPPTTSRPPWHGAQHQELILGPQRSMLPYPGSDYKDSLA
eukprot:7875820-Pyramimonas_sp.AAC.1